MNRVSQGTNRRAVLRGLGSVLIAGAFSGFAAGRGATSALVLGSIVNPDSAAVIGRAVLNAQLVESDASALASILFPAGPDAAKVPDWALASLVARIRADFAASDMVAVQGWALSRTEARLCALVAFEFEGKHDAWQAA